MEANFQRKTSLLLVQTVFLASEKQFFSHFLANPGCKHSLSVKWKGILLMISSFRLVETYFLSSGKSIFLFRALLKLLKFGCGNSWMWKLIFWLVELIFSHFSDTPSSENYFLSSGNVFLKEFPNRYGGDASSVLWKPFYLI